jgi:transposase-like protein
MKYTQSEKMEPIRMVEESSQGVQQALRELDVPRSSFYEWYRRYREGGYEQDPGVGKRTSPRGSQGISGEVLPGDRLAHDRQDELLHIRVECLPDPQGV